MQTGFTSFIKRWSLFQRFTIVSLLIMLFGMAGIGWWLGEQIKIGVIRESAVTAALYMDSFIAPNLQELGNVNQISTQHIAILNGLLRETDLGQRIVAFKVWDRQGNILYAKGPSLFSDVFPDSADQARVWQGEVVANIDETFAEKRLEQQKFNSRLIQIYSPVRLSGTNQVIAVAEFYQKADLLQADMLAAQQRSWFVVGMIMAGIYLLLVWFVRWADQTIIHQENKLTEQVTQLTELLDQNNELHQRVQRAAANATALNERLLRRISADLHDGPTQELGLALLRLDHVISQNESASNGSKLKGNEQLPIIQTALQHSLQEMRSIAAGFGMPQLEKLTITDLLKRVVHSHEKRTKTQVMLRIDPIPEQAELPIKITIYRLIQEALNNAFRHANGAAQQIQIKYEVEYIHIEVSDHGPGFDANGHPDWDKHLGLSGMRERVESLGGTFNIESKKDRGTKVIAQLPLRNSGEPEHG